MATAAAAAPHRGPLGACSPPVFGLPSICFHLCCVDEGKLSAVHLAGVNASCFIRLPV